MEKPDQDSLFVSELTLAQAKMRNYLAKLLANSSSTDDVLQECNKVLWVIGLGPPNNFLKWAYRYVSFRLRHIQSKSKLVFNGELLDILGKEEPDELHPRRDRKP